MANAAEIGANIGLGSALLAKSIVSEHPNSGSYKMAEEAADMARAKLADEARKKAEKEAEDKAKKARIAGIAGQAASMIPVVGPIAGPVVTEALGGDGLAQATSGAGQAALGALGDKMSGAFTKEAADSLGSAPSGGVNSEILAQNAKSMLPDTTLKSTIPGNPVTPTGVDANTDMTKETADTQRKLGVTNPYKF